MKFIDNICLSANFQLSESVNIFWKLLQVSSFLPPASVFSVSAVWGNPVWAEELQTKVTCLVQERKKEDKDNIGICLRPAFEPDFKTVTIAGTLSPFSMILEIWKTYIHHWKLSNNDFIL